MIEPSSTRLVGLSIVAVAGPVIIPVRMSATGITIAETGVGNSLEGATCVSAPITPIEDGFDKTEIASGIGVTMEVVVRAVAEKGAINIESALGVGITREEVEDMVVEIGLIELVEGVADVL